MVGVGSGDAVVAAVADGVGVYVGLSLVCGKDTIVDGIRNPVAVLVASAVKRAYVVSGPVRVVIGRIRIASIDAWRQEGEL